jgi:L-cystine transport system permease protein
MDIKAEAIAESFVEALKYLPQTLKLILVPLAIGIIIGTLVALIRVYKVPVLSQLFAVFIPLYQGIPIAVALVIYNLIYLMKCDDVLRFFHSSKTIADTDTIGIGIFALSMMMTCSISEVIRGSLLSIDKGQSEAAYVVGLTKVQTIRRIILPQIIPVAIPPLINNTVGLIKATSIVYTIGIAEVLSGALAPASKRYTFFEGYLAAALVYWILTIIVELLFKLAEKKAGKFRG